jgi:hypothetical protein
VVQAAAAREAAAIGGRAGDEELDPAERPLAEAGEGVAERFELAEEELREAVDPTNRVVPRVEPATEHRQAGGHDRTDVVGEIGEVEEAPEGLACPEVGSERGRIGGSPRIQRAAFSYPAVCRLVRRWNGSISPWATTEESFTLPCLRASVQPEQWELRM